MTTTPSPACSSVFGNCMKADPAHGKGVAKALGIPLSKLPKEK